MPAGRIFVVEDEALIAMELKDRLEGLGYAVSGMAARGDDALDQLAQDAPDLVLMDIRIAGDMDGIETAVLVRSRFDLPVVFLTAYHDQAILERAKIAEPFGYLLKPFEGRELRATVEMALYKSAMERERQRLTRELTDTLARVKMLSGLLPICSDCKKIHDGNGNWQQLEVYIRDHSEAEFTHGLCPGCLDKYRAMIKPRQS